MCLDSIECLYSSRVGADPISTSNGLFNSIPTAATQWGTSISSIGALLQAYCGVFMFCREKTWVSLS